MPTLCSSASNLAWIWIIETLASSKQVDASLLIDLVKRATEISEDVGKDARERVCLRILDNLFTQGIEITNDISSGPDSKISFDSSERCEEVLQCILHETSALNLKKGGPEMLKWDVQPFIMHKRICLAKCALQQLKDAIVEGSHPLLASLKEKSGLEIKNQDEITIPVDDVVSNGVAQRFGGCGTNAQKIAANGNLTPLSPKNGDDVFQDNSPNTNLLPAKRGRSVFTIENLEGQSLGNKVQVDNGSNLHSNATKKLKQDATCTPQAVSHKLVSLQGTELREFSSGRSMQHTGGEGCDFSKAHRARGLETSRFSEDGLNEASKRLGQSDVKNAKFLHNLQLIPCSAIKFPINIAGGRQGQNISILETNEDREGLPDLRTSNGVPKDVKLENFAFGGTKVKCGHGFKPNPSTVAQSDKAKDDPGHTNEPNLSSNSDGDHDERVDIATKKHTFLSSQCTHSQDSFATADLSELNLCIKCNEGGKLLACSSDSCPLVVHDKCLGSAARFDEKGKFYCPFCEYSQVNSEYLEVKRKVSLTRKDLAAFIRLGAENQPKKFSRRLRGPLQSQFRQGAELDENNQANIAENYVNGVNNPCRSNMEDKRQEEHLVSCVDDYPPCGEKDRVATNGIFCTSTENKRVGREMGQDCHSAGGLEELHIAVQPVHNRKGDNSSCRDTEIVHGNERHAGSGRQCGVLNQPVSDLPYRLACPASTGAEESSEEESDNSIASNYYIKFRKQEMQYKYPEIPQLRRKKLPWTKVEEETLKEGVQRLSNVHDIIMPWKKILEFGSEVFHKGRTTIDLKDKWRNICKGSQKSK